MLQVDHSLDVARCHGCGLCSLVCPVYQHGGSVMQTPHGLIKQLQAGAGFNPEDAMACILCGACDPICPQDIDLMRMMVVFKQAANDWRPLDAIAPVSTPAKADVIFIPDQAMQDQQDRLLFVMSHLGRNVRSAQDTGEDISYALHEGRPVSTSRMNQFIAGLKDAKEVICTDGWLQMLLKEKLSRTKVSSLGYKLSMLDKIKNQLDERDLYLMDSVAYHADFHRTVLHYDRLHKTYGCRLSRDLHRLAQPVGSRALNHFDQRRQVKWLLEGHNVERIVAESLADARLLRRHTRVPVMHITELLL